MRRQESFIAQLARHPFSAIPPPHSRPGRQVRIRPAGIRRNDETSFPAQPFYPIVHSHHGQVRPIRSVPRTGPKDVNALYGTNPELSRRLGYFTRYPVQVLFGKRFFSNFADAEGSRPKRTYFDESVFAFVLIRKCSSFHESGTTNSTHFLCRSWTGHRFCPVLPYLFRCGVSRRLFDSGPATTF